MSASVPPESPEAQALESGATNPSTSSNTVNNNSNTNSNVNSTPNIGVIIGSVCAAVIVFLVLALLIRWKWRNQRQERHKHLVDGFFAQAPAHPVQNDGARSSFSAMDNSEQLGSDLHQSLLLPPLGVDRRPTQHSVQVPDSAEQTPESFLTAKGDFLYFTAPTSHKDTRRFSKAPSHELVLPHESETFAEPFRQQQQIYNNNIGPDAAHSIHLPEHCVDASENVLTRSMRASISVVSLTGSCCCCDLGNGGGEGSSSAAGWCDACGNRVVRRSSVGSSSFFMGGADGGLSRGAAPTRIPGDLSRKGSAVSIAAAALGNESGDHVKGSFEREFVVVGRKSSRAKFET
ncbi:hypothetical protein BJ741DRAFT_621061 [Chytriomyces cf. hyalinus JEL632]|nr:hypothetical protein BJ741DRAFT_621061 [Chytriomyces cf. hyalinus JEL632]